MRYIECVRLLVGVYVDRLYENGLMVALTLGLLINGRAALYSANRSHASVAPFLNSALKFLSPNPVWEGWFFIGFSAVLGLVTACYVFWEHRMMGTRIFLAFLGMAVYIGVSVAIVTGTEPPIAAERYEVAAFLFFVAFIVNLSRFLGKGGNAN